MTTKQERHEMIFSMLKTYGCMTIKTIIERFEEDHGYKMIENQVHDFIYEFNKQGLLTLETVKTAKRSKYLVGRKDMRGA